MDREKIRELEKVNMQKLVDIGCAPVSKNQFYGYFSRVVDGEEEIYAPNGQGDFYLRRTRLVN